MDHERTSWKASWEEAEDALKKDLDNMAKRSDFAIVDPVEWGIIKRDFGDGFKINGKIGDDGNPEYMGIKVGDTPLYDALYSKFYGLKVKLKIEFEEQ